MGKQYRARSLLIQSVVSGVRFELNATEDRILTTLQLDTVESFVVGGLEARSLPETNVIVQQIGRSVKVEVHGECSLILPVLRDFSATLLELLMFELNTMFTQSQVPVCTTSSALGGPPPSPPPSPSMPPVVSSSMLDFIVYLTSGYPGEA